MGLENLLKYLEAIALMLPLIEKVVLMIEGLFNKLGVGSGETKKEAAMVMARKMAADKNIIVPDDVLSEVIDLVVAEKNKSGDFMHSADPGATP
jgi:hypothetical protein